MGGLRRRFTCTSAPKGGVIISASALISILCVSLCVLCASAATYIIQAGFSVTIDGNVAHFDDASKGFNILEWKWVFGDGGTSTEQDPVHSYAHTGNYSVSLTITDSSGRVSTTSQMVEIADMENSTNTQGLLFLGMMVVFLMALLAFKSASGRIGCVFGFMIALLLFIGSTGGIY